MQSTECREDSKSINFIQEKEEFNLIQGNKQYSQPNTGKPAMQSTKYNKTRNVDNPIQ
jgi:hypothetical protein